MQQKITAEYSVSRDMVTQAKVPLDVKSILESELGPRLLREIKPGIRYSMILFNSYDSYGEIATFRKGILLSSDEAEKEQSAVYEQEK